MCKYIIYICHMYRPDFAKNNLQWLIYHQIKLISYISCISI